MGHNQTEEETLSRWSTEGVADNYDMSFASVVGQYISLSEIEAVRTMLTLCGVGKLLDAGCGTGRHLQNLEGDCTRVGLDFSSKMLEGAREKAPGALLTVGTVENMPFPDDVFDVVICSRVLQHARDQQKAINELARVTKPSGQVIVLSYNSWTLHCLYKNLRQRGLLRPIDLPLQIGLRTISSALLQINASRLARMLNSAASRSPFARWEWGYDNYMSLPELNKMFITAGLRPVASKGATAGAPWFLFRFLIDDLLSRTLPGLLRLYCRLCWLAERHLGTKPGFKYFLDKVLLQGVKV